MAKRHSTDKYLNLDFSESILHLNVFSLFKEEKKECGLTREQRHVLDKYLITHRRPHLQNLPLNPSGTPRAAIGHGCSRGKMLDRYSLSRDTELESCQACFHLLPTLRVPSMSKPALVKTCRTGKKYDPFDLGIFRLILGLFCQKSSCNCLLGH